MVHYSTVKSSNASIASSLRSGLVAVFVGGTSGIGKYTLKELARQAKKPRIYVIGRSQEAWDHIEAECKQINSEGQYVFVQGDMSLLRNVDGLCKQILDKEKAINILFWSAGTLIRGQKTAEGLNLAAALKYYARTRAITNFLPSLQAATGLRRVVTVLVGTKEGEIDFQDFQGWNNGGGMAKQRAHSASITTLTNAYLAKRAPNVSFIHDFPGQVKSGISRGTSGILGAAYVVINALGPLFFFTPEEESGARHLYYATSARFAPQEGAEESVPLSDGVSVARGVDGVLGGGVYSCDESNEEASTDVEQLLGTYIAQGLDEKVWGEIQQGIDKILPTSNA